MPLHERVYYRETLYKEVWAKPLQHVAKRYGVSDVALAKACRKLGVPLPGRGYWARVAAGHELERPPLPPLEDGQPEHLYSHYREKVDKAPSYGEEAVRLLEREKDPAFAVTVCDAPTDPHPLVQEAAKILRKGKAARERRLSNFLPWQGVYSEILTWPQEWPECGRVLHALKSVIG